MNNSHRHFPAAVSCDEHDDRYIFYTELLNKSKNTKRKRYTAFIVSY